MSTMAVLQAFQTFLKEKVASNIKLQKADDNNVLDYSLVNPEVHIGWIPPKGYLPEGMDSAIPCLIVGFDDGSKGQLAVDCNIRISAAVYSPGLHEPSETEPEKINYTPDFQGYHDLLNLIDRTVAELDRNQIIGKLVSIDGDIKWGMYTDQQPYPYWYGWITFSVKRNAVQASEMYRQFL